MRILLILLAMTILAACDDDQNKPEDAGNKASKFIKGTFGYDLEFLKQYHKDLILLGDDNSKLIVIPAYQGRVMTSTADGEIGASFGWINHDLVASSTPAEHMNAVGGEERFWLGPEGGQFSIYFKKGAEFKFDNWYVPKEIDTEPFELVSSTNREAAFKKQMHLENYSGNQFDLTVNRTIRFLDINAINIALGLAIPNGIKAVGFESENTITNNGTAAWDKKTGMLSIWILSMMNASDQTTVAIPYRQGDPAQLGRIVTDDYFGKVPAERLAIMKNIRPQNGIILFKADALHRSKIGISPARALPVAGSYDSINHVLTIAQFTLPADTVGYVNSLWKIQEDPFNGDAVNSYNDGPIGTRQMGRFYEIESSSPAAALAPGSTMKHIHRTIHLKGTREALDKVAVKIFGIGVDKIRL